MVRFNRLMRAYRTSMRHGHILTLAVLLTFSPGVSSLYSQTAKAEVVIVDAKAASHPLPHFWEKMFGSGRAILSLREDYRSDLRVVKGITGFEYVRFHAIFHDEVGL